MPSKKKVEPAAAGAETAASRGRLFRRVFRRLAILLVLSFVGIGASAAWIAQRLHPAGAQAGDSSEQRSLLLIWAAAGAAILLLVAIGAAWFMARALAAPIDRVSRWARQLAGGNLATQLEFRPDDEVGQVAESLDCMRAVLSGKIREVQKKRRDLEVTVSHLAEGVIAIDDRQHVLTANPAARRFLGVGTSLTGGPLREQLGDRSLGRLWDEAVAAGRESLRREIVMSDGRDERTVDVSVSRIRDPDSPIAWLLCLRDVTAAARTAAMKTDFVANASHELRTPVASIRAAVETLLANDCDGPTRARFLSVIERGAARLQDLTDDLVQLNRLESPTREPEVSRFPPAAVFDALRRAFAEALSARRIEFTCVSNVPEIATDRPALELALHNLIDNGVKFVRAGGRVELRCDPAPGGGVLFRVSDNGCGIAPEHLGRVFERFYQADPSRAGGPRGSGLGLAIVKHAVRRVMGGDVWIESKLREGTTVFLTIPPPPDAG